MRNKLIISSIVLIAIMALFIFIIFFQQERIRYGKVCFKENCFYVEVPLTEDGMIRGLMFREHLDEDKGMLFIFDREDIHPFWMKNTLIPLDIVWINESMNVVFISKNTQPCGTGTCHDIIPAAKARYVLEINGGIADEIRLKAGDKITFDKPIENIVVH